MKAIAITASAASALAVATPAMAQSMNAEVFHKRAQALKKKGARAIFSRGEIKNLMKEVQAAAGASRERRLAAIKAGQPPRYCPTQARGSMGSSELMERLAAIPPAERAQIDMTEAMMRILAAKFPCKA